MSNLPHSHIFHNISPPFLRSVIKPPHRYMEATAHLFRALTLISGHRHARFSAVYFGRIDSSNAVSFPLVICNTRVLVQLYFTLQVYVSHRDSSIICAIFIAVLKQVMQTRITRWDSQSRMIVVCGLCGVAEGSTSHGKVLRT
jgi:hypothetical protein